MTCGMPVQHWGEWCSYHDPGGDTLKATQSRQRRYIVEHNLRGLCRQCSEPLAEGSIALCLKHLIQHREYQRKRLGSKTRFNNSLSYKREREENNV